MLSVSILVIAAFVVTRLSVMRGGRWLRVRGGGWLFNEALPMEKVPARPWREGGRPRMPNRQVRESGYESVSNIRFKGCGRSSDRIMVIISSSWTFSVQTGLGLLSLLFCARTLLRTLPRGPFAVRDAHPLSDLPDLTSATQRGTIAPTCSERAGARPRAGQLPRPPNEKLIRKSRGPAPSSEALQGRSSTSRFRSLRQIPRATPPRASPQQVARSRRRGAQTRW